jgi:hypothetical protein
MANLKLVAVLITAFTKIKDPAKMLEYIFGCLTDGMAAALYESPAISAVFYTAGNEAWAALDTAITIYNGNVTPNNLKIVKAKMALCVVWMRSYAVQVQAIANLPINAATREEIVINIEQSYLTAQKLTSSEKGAPEQPSLTGKNLGIGEIGVQVINTGVTFDPQSIIILAVSVPVAPVTTPPSPTPPPADVTLSESGVVRVTSTVGIDLITLTLNGKAREVTFTGLITGTWYYIYAYSKNNNKKLSDLTVPILVRA